jgi:hypothetical protein
MSAWQGRLFTCKKREDGVEKSKGRRRYRVSMKTDCCGISSRFGRRQGLERDLFGEIEHPRQWRCHPITVPYDAWKKAQGSVILVLASRHARTVIFHRQAPPFDPVCSNFRRRHECFVSKVFWKHEAQRSTTMKQSQGQCETAGNCVAECGEERHLEYGHRECIGSTQKYIDKVLFPVVIRSAVHRTGRERARQVAIASLLSPSSFPLEGVKTTG